MNRPARTEEYKHGYSAGYGRAAATHKRRLKAAFYKGFRACEVAFGLNGMEEQEKPTDGTTDDTPQATDTAQA